MSGGGAERSPESENRNYNNPANQNNRKDRKKEKPRTQETQGTEHFPKNQYHSKS